MSRFSKKGKVSAQFLESKMLCPHCGNEDFKVVETKASWLFGQKFKCAKCGGTFRKANLVRVHEKKKEFHVQQQGYKHTKHH